MAKVPTKKTAMHPVGTSDLWTEPAVLTVANAELWQIPCFVPVVPAFSLCRRDCRKLEVGDVRNKEREIFVSAKHVARFYVEWQSIPVNITEV